MSTRWLSLPCALIGLALPTELLAQGLEAMTVAPAEGGGQTYTLSIQILLFMTALSLLPGALLMMTSFARIIIR
ncbi:MAG: hypothetical protein AB2813_15625 [Candidatus Sedimenticola endophacoides]